MNGNPAAMRVTNAPSNLNRAAQPPCSPSAPAPASASGDLVDMIRMVVARLAGGPDEDRDLAIGLVELHFRAAAEAEPVTQDLRPWQLLASDLATALLPHDQERAEKAQVLADEIRATVVMIARNPAEELMIRPASRRVLLALHEAQGCEDIKALRIRCGISATNLSNLLKPLRAHGLISERAGDPDRRAKVVSLTRKGREALATPAKPAVTPPPSFTSSFERSDPVAVNGSYPHRASHGG